MKIRIIRFSSLGDCVLLCPFLAHLKAHGAEHVSVVTKTEYMTLFASAAGVDQVIALQTAAGSRGLYEIMRSHRKDDCVIVDAHNTMRSRALSRGLGGADVRIDKHYRERFELIWFKRQKDLPTMSERYSKLGEELGFPPVELRTGGITVPASAVRHASDVLKNHERYVAMAPGSRWPMKQWGVDKFTRLAKRIVETHGYPLVLLGDENDAAIGTHIASTVGNDVVNLIGQTNIMDAAAILERAHMMIGNDSGLMHLAEAVATPVIALFGPTVEAFGYYPAMAESRVIERDISCRPCSRNGKRNCPKGTQECMTMIPVDTVDNVFLDVIAEKGRARYVVN